MKGEWRFGAANPIVGARAVCKSGEKAKRNGWLMLDQRNNPSPDREPNPGDASLSRAHSGWVVVVDHDPALPKPQVETLKEKLEEYLTKNSMESELTSIDVMPALGIMVLRCSPRVAGVVGTFPEVQSIEPEGVSYASDE